jgi:ribosomal protein S1
MITVKDEVLKKEKIKLYNTDETGPYLNELLQLYLESEGNFNYQLTIKEGMVTKGKVIGQLSDYILVDINHKDYVMIEKKREEMSYVEKVNLKSGDTVDVLITSISEDPYLIKGSIAALNKSNTYDEIINNSETHSVSATVMEAIPAGYILEIFYNEHKIPAFMPNILAGINKLNDPNSIVGDTFNVMIESFSDEKGTFIVSRKKYLQSLIPHTISELKSVDETGYPIPYQGKVTGTAKFGVFVEFNECLTGMIHKDNMSEETLSTLDLIKPGDNFNFFIKEIVKNKLFLTQVWRQTLWDTLEIDNVFEGVVSESISFGTLILLDDETKGIIHNAELEKSKRTLKTGDKVKVKVLSIQRMDRKIYLGLV